MLRQGKEQGGSQKESRAVLTPDALVQEREQVANTQIIGGQPSTARGCNRTAWVQLKRKGCPARWLMQEEMRNWGHYRLTGGASQVYIRNPLASIRSQLYSLHRQGEQNSDKEQWHPSDVQGHKLAQKEGGSKEPHVSKGYHSQA